MRFIPARRSGAPCSGHAFQRLAVALLAAFAIAASTFGLPAALVAQDLNGYFPAPGQTQLALSYTSESWDHFWRGTVKVHTPPFLETADIKTTSLWGRHGITDRLAVVGTLNYVDAHSDGVPEFEQSTLQDLTVFAKYRFKRIEHGAVRQTLAGAVGVRSDVGGYEANLPVDAGDGTTDALFRFIYQVERGRFYFSQQIGYDLRSEDAPDGFPLYTELGFQTGRLTWIGSLQVLRADGGTDIGDPGFTFPSNKEEYERYGLRVFARVNDRLGISVGGFGTLDGRNTADTTGFFAGLVTSLGS